MATTTTTNTTNSNINSDVFLSTLQDKLINQAGMVSSQDTNLENSINQAISGTAQAGEASAKRIESQYGREIGYAKQTQADTITQAQEKQRGYGVNIAAMRQLVDSTDKNIKDLEQRKQESLLANDSATASKISDLQIKAYEFKQKAMQDTFTNLLSVGNFALSASQQAEQKRQFNQSLSFQEKSAMSALASQYGVVMREGDTLDTITARVAPFASEKQRLEIAKTKAEISRANAEAQKALRGDDTNADALTVSLIAQAGLQNPAALSLIKDAKLAAKVQLQMSTMSKGLYTGSGIDSTLEQSFSSGRTRNDIQAEIQANNFLTPNEKAIAEKKAIDFYLKKAEEAAKAKRFTESQKAPQVSSPVGFFSNMKPIF